MRKNILRLSRRDLLRMAPGGIGALALTGMTARGAAAASGPVVTENQRAGTSSWRLTNPAGNGEIEGYASLTSVNRGGQIQLFVSTGASSYTIEIYRMGWYGGAGGRLMLGPITRTGGWQPDPHFDPATGMTECAWTNPYVLTVPFSATDPTVWMSGVYLAKLTAGAGGPQSYIMFVVRDDARNSDLLFQSSVTTFQAYNRWGGKCLYDYLSSGGRARKVSFNRPYAPLQGHEEGVGAAEFLTGGDGGPPAGWEYNMVRWLEREGYDVTYCTNIDTHANPELLFGHKGFLSVGHDEYWSWEMRQNVTAARDEGVSLGFFSANSIYWQVRLEASPRNGAPDRTLVCYKYTPLDYIGTDTEDPLYRDGDPSNDHLITVRWRDSLPGSNRVALPEEMLIGTQYQFQADNVHAPLVVEKPAHWVFAGTGLVAGSSIPGLVGYEADRMHGNSPVGTERLCRSPWGGSHFSDLTVYRSVSGATVFATGTMQFCWALDNYNAPEFRPAYLSPAAQQMTRNVLARFLSLQPPASNVPSANPGGPYSGRTGEPIHFNGGGSGDSDGVIDSYEWDFGDGGTGTGVTTSHVYATPGTYTVTLWVTDNSGTRAAGTTTATVVGFFASVTADSVFDETSDQRYYYPASGVGDGVVPVPNGSDLFKQWLSQANRPMDAGGILAVPINLTMVFSRRETLNGVRIFQSSYPQQPGFHSRNIRFYLRNSGGAWSAIGQATLPNVNGGYVDIPLGGVSADEARVEVLSTYDTGVYRGVGLSEVQFFLPGQPQPPVANPGGPYQAVIGRSLEFNGSGSADADDAITSYNWDFGDGASGTGVRPTHTYQGAGVFTVRLTVTDQSGQASSATTTATVDAYRAYKNVTADSVFDVSSDRRYHYPASAIGDGIVPVPVPADQFNQWFSAGGHSMDGAGVLATPINVYITFWQRETVTWAQFYQVAWPEDVAFMTRDFRFYLRVAGGEWALVGTGTLPAAGRQPTFIGLDTPMAADEARIEVLSSYDTYRYRGVGMSEVEVFTTSNPGNRPPVARIGGPYEGSIGRAVQFDGSGSADADGSIASYAWDFGDGTTGTGPSPAHTYQAAGTFTARLTVTDNGGKTSTATTPVLIEAVRRFASVTADSVFDVTTDQRYYYPASAVGDGVVPVPSPADQFKQWFSAMNHAMDGAGVLTTPVNVFIRLWERQTVSRVRLYQTSFYEAGAFQTRDFRLYTRLSGGAWVLAGSGTLPPAPGQSVEVAVPAAAADEVRIEIVSSYDTARYRGVGISEVEIL